MFSIDPWRLAVFALTLGLGSIATGQDSTLSTTPLTTLPTVSNQRLGTGVPSRLPKADVPRPVFTIQSGGPVTLPMPQFRPIREVTPTVTPENVAKGSLPIIEQTRPWQKSSNQNITASERTTQTPPARPIAVRTAPPGIRPATASGSRLPPYLTAESATAERRVPSTAAPSPQQRIPPRPAATPAPVSETPARVLNFRLIENTAEPQKSAHGEDASGWVPIWDPSALLHHDPSICIEVLHASGFALPI